RDLMHFKQQVALKYAELVYYGLWFTPLREALGAFVAQTQQEVTGQVKLKLYKGNIDVDSRESEFSLYRTDLSSFTIGSSYDQKDADAFSRIRGLPARCLARLRHGKVGVQEATKLRCGQGGSGNRWIHNLSSGNGRSLSTKSCCASNWRLAVPTHKLWARPA